MRITLEPSKFEHILRVALIGDNKTLLEKCTVELRDTGIVVKDRSYNSVINHSIYSDAYFKEYKKEANTSPDKVVLTKSLLDKLKLFKSEKEMTIEVTSTTISMKSPKVSYEEELLQPSDEEEFGIEMQKTEFGLMPKKLSEEGSHTYFTIDASHLNDLPDSETITFRTTKENTSSLECEIVDRGITKMSFPISPDENRLSEINYTGNFNGSVLSKIISNLTGSVHMILTDTGLVINNKNPDYVLTYVQAAQAQKRTVEVEPEE